VLDELLGTKLNVVKQFNRSKGQCHYLGTSYKACCQEDVSHTVELCSLVGIKCTSNVAYFGNYNFVLTSINALCFSCPGGEEYSESSRF
jgi:hypothetical protein